MNEEKKYKTKVIVDLLELRNNQLRMQSINIQQDVFVQNNTFYSFLDCLIANLMDKYGINDELIRNEIISRKTN